MAAVPDLMQELLEKKPDVKSVILCGIETHACIYHTSLDLIADHGIDVHVVVDCCSSRYSSGFLRMSIKLTKSPN